MCKMVDYPGLYMQTQELLRLDGVNPTIPGYELLRKAIVICKIDGWKDVLKKVGEDTVIPSINPVVTDKTPVEQWLAEAIKSIGSPLSVKEYIEEKADFL